MDLHRIARPDRVGPFHHSPIAFQAYPIPLFPSNSKYPPGDISRRGLKKIRGGASPSLAPRTLGSLDCLAVFLESLSGFFGVVSAPVGQVADDVQQLGEICAVWAARLKGSIHLDGLDVNFRSVGVHARASLRDCPLVCVVQCLVCFGSLEHV